MRFAVVLVHMGWQVKESEGSCGRPRCRRGCEGEQGSVRCPLSRGGRDRADVFFEQSLVTFGRVNPRKTRRKTLLQFLRTFENSKQNPAAYDASLHARGISEFATTYPSTNDYPFDFALSLLLLQRRGGTCCFTVGEELLVSGLVSVYLASKENGAGGK